MSEFYMVLAKYYDLIYSWKDYKTEVEGIHQLIQKHKISAGKTLLDVACGTGKHIEHFKVYYDVTGLDLSEEMLKIARANIGGVEFIQSDMVQMNLEKQFDIITCLFGSFNYLHTRSDREKTVKAFSNHLKKGGIVVIEPMFTEETLILGHLGFNTVDEPDAKIARMNLTRREGDLVFIDFQFLVGTPDGISHYTEPSPMSVFSHNEIITIMEDNGFQVTHEKSEFTKGAGLFVGIKQ